MSKKHKLTIGDRVNWTDPETKEVREGATITDVTGEIVSLLFPDQSEVEALENEITLVTPYDKYDYTPIAEQVMDDVARFLADRISIDEGDGAVYFNDDENKFTFRIQLERCPIYAHP